MAHVLPSELGPPQMVAANWKRGKAESADARRLQVPWGQLCIHLRTQWYMYVVTLGNTCSCHTVLIHGLIQQIMSIRMLHGGTAVLLSPAAPPRALPKVLFIMSTRPCIPRYSSVPLHIHGICTWNTESITHMYSVGFYSQWQTFLSAPRCQQHGTRLPEWLHHTSQPGHKSLWSRQSSLSCLNNNVQQYPQHPHFHTKTRQNQLTRVRKYIQNTGYYTFWGISYYYSFIHHINQLFQCSHRYLMHPSDLHMKACWSSSPTVPQWSYISIHAEDSICDNHLDPTTAAVQLVLQVSHVNVPVPQLLCFTQPANAYIDHCIISVHCAILHTSYGNTANCWENSIQATDEPTKLKTQIHIQIHCKRISEYALLCSIMADLGSHHANKGKHLSLLPGNDQLGSLCHN